MHQDVVQGAQAQAELGRFPEVAHALSNRHGSSYRRRCLAASALSACRHGSCRVQAAPDLSAGVTGALAVIGSLGIVGGTLFASLWIIEKQSVAAIAKKVERLEARLAESKAELVAAEQKMVKAQEVSCRCVRPAVGSAAVPAVRQAKAATPPTPSPLPAAPHRACMQYAKENDLYRARYADAARDNLKLERALEMKVRGELAQPTPAPHLPPLDTGSPAPVPA